jgi:copper homeostasis protein
MKVLEICTFSLLSAQIAQACGAKRIELCGGMPEGGTTPSAGLLKAVRNSIQIPIYVMIRPRGGDFLYNLTEIQTMEHDIEMAKNLGADGLVFGCLDKNGHIDQALTARLVALAHPLGVTFHRAFDRTANASQALEAVINSGCERILTSGQANTADLGLEVLTQICQQAQGRIEIMAGSGVNAHNASTILATGVDALHFSAKRIYESAMLYRGGKIWMGGNAAVPEFELAEADPQKIKELLAVLQE